MKFTRHEGGQKKRVPTNWRKPRGHQNKMRLQKKGHRIPISTGYGAPGKTKGNVKGMPVCFVHTIADLAACPKDAGVIIAASVGMKKRLTILEEAQAKNIKILNINDVDAYVKAFDEKRKRQAEEKKAAEKAHKEEKKAQKEEAEKQEKLAKEAENPEEEDAKEKKEKEKILHHKQ